MVQAAAVQAREFYLLGQLFVRKPEIPVRHIKLIKAALGRGHQAVVPEKTRFTAQEAQRILAEAGRHLLSEKDTQASALILSQNTAERLRDKTEAALLRCEALVLLQRRDEAVAEADRLLAQMPADPGRDAALLALMDDSKLAHGLRLPLRLHDEFWGPSAPTLVEMVGALVPSLFGGVFDAAFLDYLSTARGTAPEDRDSLHNELGWGFAQARYLAMLEGTTAGDEADATTPSLARYRSDFAQIRGQARLDALLPLLDQGKSVVLLQSHSGIRGLVSSGLAQMDWPLSLVGQSQRDERGGKGDYNIVTQNAVNLPVQFLKLSKLMKKGQRIVRIFPDGHDGREMRQIDLFGRRIMIGMGGASLGFYGRAQLAFAKTHWTGSDWDIQVDIGPDLATAQDIDTAEDMFADYYAQSLCDILTGPAKDIGGLGGMIHSLRFHFDAPARSFPLRQLFVPSSGESEAGVTTIRSALRLERDAAFPGTRNLSFHQANHTIVQAGWNLANDPETAASALSLARGAAPELRNSKAVTQLRLAMIGRREGRAALLDEANRMLALPALNGALDAMIVNLLDQNHVLHQVTPLERLHDRIWGEPAESYAATLNALKTRSFERLYADDFLVWLGALRGSPMKDIEKLRHDLAWLPCQNAYWTYLRGMDRRDPGRPLAADPETQHQRDILFAGFAKSAATIAATKDLTPIRSLLRAGRGIVMLHSHSNPVGLWPSLLNGLDVPLSMVARLPVAGRDNPADFDIITENAADIPMQFLKLAKLHRKGQRLTRIFPDGQHGQAPRPVDIFGRAVQIGMEGSVLAYFGKAMLVFARAHWTGNRWRADFKVGPDLALAADQAGADDLFADFYADCLKGLLLGPLKDVGAAGGFLGMLNRPAQ